MDFNLVSQIHLWDVRNRQIMVHYQGQPAGPVGYSTYVDAERSCLFAGIDVLLFGHESLTLMQ